MSSRTSERPTKLPGLVDIFRPLVTQRYLLSQLVSREVQAKFKRSRLGLLWVVASPLLLLSGYTLVFGVLMKARWGGAGTSMEFALVLFAGLIFFNFFGEVIGKSPALIPSNTPYVKKMVFPLEVLGWSTMLSALVNAGIGIGVWIIFSLFVKGSIPLTILWLPVVFVPFALFTLGVCWFLSAYSVFHPDAEHIVPVGLLMMMFISPLFFSVDSLPETFRSIVIYNPLTYALEEGRGVLIGGRAPNLFVMSVAYPLSIGVAWLGLASFLGNREGFADAL